MVKRPRSFLDRLAQRRALARWSRAARMVEALDPAELRLLRGDAKALRREVNRVLHVAEARLALPMVGAEALPHPLGTDWAWRPELWRGPVHPAGVAPATSRATLGSEVTLFHDCPLAEIALRQVRNTRPEDIAPHGLRMEVFRFDGSFLSLALDLPEAGVTGLRLNHLVRMDLSLETERPMDIFCRLNVKHGPNTETVVRELPLRQGESWVEFDLAYTRMNEKRVERAWIDMIFDGPQMNRVTLRDLTLSRRPRAEL